MAGRASAQPVPAADRRGKTGHLPMDSALLIEMLLPFVFKLIKLVGLESELLLQVKF